MIADIVQSAAIVALALGLYSLSKTVSKIIDSYDYIIEQLRIIRKEINEG